MPSRIDDRIAYTRGLHSFSVTHGHAHVPCTSRYGSRRQRSSSPQYELGGVSFLHLANTRIFKFILILPRLHISVASYRDVLTARPLSPVILPTGPAPRSSPAPAHEHANMRKSCERARESMQASLGPDSPQILLHARNLLLPASPRRTQPERKWGWAT